ncbi:Elongator complex protein [Globisporangium polare]
MSSFRRKTPSPAATGAAAASGAPITGAFVPAPRRQLSGTKPFLNGQTLLSSGLAQLDAILGGGLLLGTLVLLETPRSDAGASSVALVDDVHRYFAGEGVVSGQCAMLIAQDAAGFAQHQLPLELSLAQKQVKQQLALLDVAAKQQQQQKSGEAQAEQDDAKLTIAWQYGKYLSTDGPQQQQRFCHSFDLSRPIHRELLEANPPVLVDTLSLDGSSPQAAYAQLLQKIEAEIKARTGQAVLRVSMLELGSPMFGAADGAHMAALFAFVRTLRALVSSQPAVCVLSGPLFVFPVEFDNEIRHHCDYVLEFKSFMGENDMLPAELSEFHGLMDIRKLARVHSLANNSVDAMKYGVKRERRKLKIEKFHLPPEGSRSSGNSNSNNDLTSSKSKSNLLGSSFTTKSKSASCGSGSSSGVFDPLAF